MTIDDLRRLVRIFPWQDWTDRLKDELGPLQEALLQAGGEAGAADLRGRFDGADPRVVALRDGLGERIVSIQGTAKDDVIDVLQRTFAEVATAGEDGGPTVFDLGTRIFDAAQGALDARWRADRIARTESATLFNLGNLTAFQQNGIEHVEVSDGDGCDICAAIDGEIWTVDEAMANPTEHPNCLRAFAPVETDLEEVA